MQKVNLTIIIYSNFCSTEGRQMNSCTTCQSEKEILARFNICVINDLNVNSLCHFFRIKCDYIDNGKIVLPFCNTTKNRLAMRA